MLQKQSSLFAFVAICFELTDFAYWLFLADLGVDLRYERKGIGKQLVTLAQEPAEGENETVRLACATDSAIPFYEKVGMNQATDSMIKGAISLTSFDVRVELS